MAVPSLEFKIVEAAIGLDVSIAGCGMKASVDSVKILGSVAAMQVHRSLEAREFDLAIASAEVDVTLARHLDDDVNTVRAPLYVEIVVRIADVDFNHVAGLSFLNANSALADLVKIGR